MSSWAMAMSADGKWIVIGRVDGHLLTVRAADGQVVQDWRAHQKLIDVVRISPDGQTLISGGSDGAVLLSRWRTDQNGWETLSARSLPGEVDGITIDPGGTGFITSSKPASLHFWSLADGAMLRQIVLPTTAWRLAMSSDGARLAVGTWDRAIQIWDTQSMPASVANVRQEIELVGHTQLITGEAFDSTGKLMASVSTDGAVRLWDVTGSDRAQTGPPPGNRRRCLLTLDSHAGDATSVAFLRSGDTAHTDALAVGFIDGTVRIWDLGAFAQLLNGHIEHQRLQRRVAGYFASP